MQLPINLDAWNFESVVAIVRKHEYEPGSFDYKGILAPSRTAPIKDEFNASLRRTVCSMANADGGFILFGVRDREQPVNSPDERIVGISLKGDLRKIFSEKISTLQRPVYFTASPKAIALPTDSQRGVFVVYIPQSPLRPHMDVSTGCFYRRGEGGKADKMNFYEVREQMIYTEDRLRRVTLLRLEIAQYQELIRKMLDAGTQVVLMLYRFDTSAFKVLLADVSSLLPASTDLLQNLLNIPLQANMINEFISLTSGPNMPSFMSVDPNYWEPHAEGIRANLNTLKELCTTCEVRLNEIFGPLTEV
jgi:hypothetical protein